ncbi:MAG: T9SS type A sorting domain-containing protein [Bacteroidota bacterium]
MRNTMKTFFLFMFCVFIIHKANAQWIETTLFSSECIDNMLVVGNDVYAGAKTGPGGLFKSTDNGVTWNASDNGITYKQIYALATDGTNLYAGTWNGGMYKSTNNGSNWSAINNGISFPCITALACSGSTLWAGAFNGEMYYSTNSGSSWTLAGQPYSYGPEAILIDGTKIYAGFNNGVHITTNNGTTWTNSSAGFTDSTVMSILLDGSTLFAASWGGGVFRSVNGGNSWTATNTGLGSWNVFPLLKNGNNLFAGTQGAGVHQSTDNGNTWTAINTGFVTYFPSYCLVANSTHLFTGSYGTHGGVWRRPLSELQSIDDNSASNTFRLFPNPAVNEVSLTFNEPIQDDAVVRIYNSVGEEIQNLKINKSESSVKIDISKLPAGVYLVKMNGYSDRFVKN